MTATLIPDHVQLAKDRLICSLKQSVSVNDLLGALVQETQEVEQVFIDRQTQIRLEDAVGAQLDGIGALLGVDRNALDDDTYRLRIQAQILINSVSGTRPEVIEVINSLVQFTSAYLALTPGEIAALTTTVHVRDYYPKASIVAWQGLELNKADITSLGVSLADVAPLGTNTSLTSALSAYGPTFKFSDIPDAGTLATGRGFGEGAFVALARTTILDFLDVIDDIMLETLPFDWEQETSGTSTFLRKVAYGDGRWMIGGSSGLLLSSDDDGVTWATRTPDASYTGAVLNIHYDNGLWVFVGVSGEIQTSPDGTTWTQRTPDASYALNINGIFYGNGLWTFVGVNGELQTSPDGITWTARTSGVATELKAVAYIDAIWIAVGGVGVILTSTDATTWTARTAGGGFTGTFNAVSGGLIGGNPLYCIVGASAEIQSSLDFMSWTPITPDGGYTGAINDIDYGGSGMFTFVGTGPEIQVSETGTSWAAATVAGSFAGTLNGVGNGPTNRWLIVGSSGEIQSSGT